MMELQTPSAGVTGRVTGGVIEVWRDEEMGVKWREREGVMKDE